MRNYIQPGDIITVPAPYALASSAGCLVGSLFGISSGIAAQGDPAEIKTTGVFRLNADAPAAAALGAKAYWDDAAKQVTATAGGNKLIGVFTFEKMAGTAFAEVRLNGVSV